MKAKSKSNKKLNFKKTVLMIGYIPLLTANTILTLYAAYMMRSNLEESVYLRLKACATSVEQYFTWDIREDILCKDDVSYSFIDSLQDDNIELTFFVEDTRYLTSIRDEQDKRIEDTKADPVIWEKVKADLVSGKQVLFSGTPCDNGALRAYLKKNYNNLICIDFICMGTPSPLVWKRHISDLGKKYGSKANHISFRPKKYGAYTHSLSRI